MFDFSRATLHQALAAAVFLTFAVAPATAQSYRSALGLTGGWSAPADLTPGLGTATTPEAGWTLGLQHERWWGSRRVATRLNAGYAERMVKDSPNQYQMLSADAGLLIRILRPSRDRALAPFVGLGAGAVAYAPLFGSSPLGEGVYGDDDPVVRVAVVGSAGADLYTGSRLGFRIEALDQVVLPSIGYSPASTGVPRVHNLEVRSALQLRLGRDAAPAVVVLSQPVTQPVTAAAAPAAAPTAAPADPTAPDATVTALRLLDRLEEQAREIGRLQARLEALERDEPAAMSAPRALGTPIPAPGVLGTPIPDDPPATFDGPLFTVQVASFIEPATATRWADRLARRGLPVRVAEHVVRGQKVNRVRVGAIPSRAEADRLARQLQAAYGWEVWVDRVGDSETLPRDAVPATLRFLATR